MRARGPGFAWWVLPTALLASGLVGVGVRFSVGGDRKLDVSAVRPPKGYVDSKLSMERLADSAGIGSANGTPRALWHTEDQPGRVMFLFSDNKPVSGGDAEQLDELKRALNESG